MRSSSASTSRARSPARNACAALAANGASRVSSASPGARGAGQNGAEPDRPFAARVAHALRAGDRAREVSRSSSGRAPCSRSSARRSRSSRSRTRSRRRSSGSPSCSHVERVGIYLREDGPAARCSGTRAAEGHEEVADALLGAALGPLRARAAVARCRRRDGAGARACAPRARGGGTAVGARGAAARARRADRPARRLPGARATLAERRTHCSPRSPPSSPSPCRTRGCTSARRSSATRSAPCSRRSARRRGG